jgi:hypothetical protein
MPPEVASAFGAFSPDVRRCLSEIRAMIIEVAAGDSRIGAVTEALKWGQPAYLTAESGSGSTIRLGVLRSDPERGAIFFHCRTTVVDDVRHRFGGLFEYEGRRAVLLPPADALPRSELETILATALTYHLRR